MQTNLKQRIENFDLPNTDVVLHCLGEAVVNSMQSILLTEQTKGLIDIHLKTLSSKEDEAFQINSFDITDNGQGFTEDNFNSFTILDDTKKKITFACKGIGRLLYLKVFAKVKVVSAYLENGENRERCFCFDSDWTETQELLTKFAAKPCNNSVLENKTTLSFENLIHNDDEKFSIEDIKEFLLTHFLATFIHAYDQNKEIFITLRVDKSASITFSIADIYNELFIPRHPTIIPIDKTVGANHELIATATTIQLYHIERTKAPKYKKNVHRVIYCAGFRELKNEGLSGFTEKPYRKNGADTYYVVYVLSELLNKNSNSNRSDTSNFKNKSKIEKLVTDAAHVYLKPIVIQLEKDKNQKVEQLLKRNPAYSYLKNDLHKTISYDLDDKSINKSMYHLHVEKRTEQRNGIMNGLSSHLENHSREMLDSIEVSAMADLAEYMVYRQIILKQMQQVVDQAKKQKLSFETLIQQFIAPRCHDSKFTFDQNNLWLIDDRFTAYEYQFAETYFKNILDKAFTDTDSRDIAFINKRPDIYLLDRCNDKYNVVAIELKGVYAKSSDMVTAIDQLFERVEQLSTPPLQNYINEAWYYAIIEINDDVRKRAKGRMMKPLFGGNQESYYIYNSEYNVHIYILSYSTLITDAKMRHKVFFDLIKLE